MQEEKIRLDSINDVKQFVQTLTQYDDEFELVSNKSVSYTHLTLPTILLV